MHRVGTTALLAALLAVAVLPACSPAPSLPEAAATPTPLPAGQSRPPGTTTLPPTSGTTGAAPGGELSREAAALASALRDKQVRLESEEKRLLASYQALETRRKALAGKTGAEVEAFNVEAAAYLRDRTQLKKEQTELHDLTAREAAARKAFADFEKPAVEALARVRSAINARDSQALLAALIEARKWQDRAAFAAIDGLANTQFARIRQIDFEAPLPTPAAVNHGREIETVTKEIQNIVNQLPMRIEASGVSKGAFLWVAPEMPGKPDLGRITLEDFRRNQELKYSRRLVRREVDPVEYYQGDDTEINLNTIFFYTDRSRPKKKLSDSEYLQLVTLYHRLAELEDGARTAARGAPPLAATERAFNAFNRWLELKRDWPR